MPATRIVRRVHALEKRMPPINAVSMAWRRQNARALLKFEDLMRKLDEPFDENPEAHALLTNDSNELRAKDEALYSMGKIFEDAMLPRARETVSKLSPAKYDMWHRRWAAAPDGKGKCSFELWALPLLDFQAFKAEQKASKKRRRRR